MEIKVIHFVTFLFFSLTAFGQNDYVFQHDFEWSEQTYVSNYVTEKNDRRITFDQAIFESDNPLIATFANRFDVVENGDLRVEIESVEYLDVSPYLELNKNSYENAIREDISKLPSFTTRVDQNRDKYYGKVFIKPYAKNSQGEILYVKSISYRVIFKKTNDIVQKKPPVTRSVLADGSIYKLRIEKTGVHKLTTDFLQSTLGINLQDLQPSTIQVFGNEGGKIAFRNEDERVDDLNEIPILVTGEDDGQLSGNDAVYFYAEGAESWNLTGEDYMDYNDNPFDIYNYVFLRINLESGKRLSSIGTNVSDVSTVSEYLDVQRYERNETNLLQSNFGTLGSGQVWFGEYFDINKVQNFSNRFDFQDLIAGTEARIKTVFAGRASSSNRLDLSVGSQLFSRTMSSVSLSSYTSDYARLGIIDEIFEIEANPEVQLDYSQNANAVGWLDYIELQMIKELTLRSGQLEFNSINSSTSSQFNLTISNSKSGNLVWDITNEGNYFNQNLLSDNTVTSFTCNGEEQQKFVIFDPSSSLLTPEFIGQLDNQNLHGIDRTDMVIIAHKTLLDEANRLADHRRNHSGISIEVVDVVDVYNEFGSGRMEPTAIRDFLRMIYDRDDLFKYALLFGNGSYDYKGIRFEQDKTNLVPIYETRQGLNPIKDFPSDDFYGLLSLQDGGDLIGELDLAVGRIPVANSTQAATVVDKIIKYDTDPSLRGPWNLRSVFAADDEDGNAHINPADDIGEDFLSQNEDINLSKIYWDAFTQVSTPGGERYPSVTDEINGSIFNGALTFCYLGHGGPSGWAQERVLQVKDIDNWSNERSFPLFVTATCSFASIDDPEVFSAGEKVLVSEHGGIGLFTTCRAVYSSDNTRLTTAVFDFMTAEDSNGNLLTLGEILRRAKNNSPTDTVDVNARKFLLLGDPSMNLLYPQNEVYTTHINDVELASQAFTDTISALSEMKIKGFVGSNGSIISDFDGEIWVTVFDKRTTRSTLAQDPRSLSKNFKEQRNLLFKGKAKVTAGQFELAFIVPKDILFQIGQGKISYYASDGVDDARGSYNDFLVGGSSNNPVEDDTPPLVQVFMNDENFVSGGQTDENPIIFAKISDDLGINLSGSSVGHDLTGTLDGTSEKTYFLNDFYESELNNFSQGVVRYPLAKLENGEHRITVRAWDIANNVGEGFTEFVVSDNPKDGLSHVLNYPNPFTDNTCFMFEHNFGSDVLDVEINIYTSTGKVVKTISHNTVTSGYRVNDIKWDGLDDFGSKLARGVYLYRIKVRSNSKNVIKESQFEKLVILK